MEQQSKDPLAGFVRTLQIIVGALVFGVFFFMMIVLFVMKAKPEPLDMRAVLSLTAIGFFLVSVVARLIIPGLIAGAACKRIASGTWTPQSGVTQAQRSTSAFLKTDEGKLVVAHQTKTIIGSALLEGAAFFCLLAYMMEGQIYTIALSVALMLAILAGFPTRGGVDSWIERQIRRVKEIRDMPQYR